MSYYRVCHMCGAALDHGESCEFQYEETAASATNTDSGKADPMNHQ